MVDFPFQEDRLLSYNENFRYSKRTHKWNQRRIASRLPFFRDLDSYPISYLFSLQRVKLESPICWRVQIATILYYFRGEIL